MDGAVIETEDLRRSFGDVEAVAGVDLAVQSGEIYGFLGPNGAGKSTVVKLLTTLLKPTGGTARVLAFLTSSTVPLDQLTGWLRTVARYDPITYILESMRPLTGDTWEWAELGKGRLAVIIVATVSYGPALMALRGRLDRG